MRCYYRYAIFIFKLGAKVSRYKNKYSFFDLTKYLDLPKYCQFMGIHSIIRVVY
jgi:hypothetical protein